MNKNVSKTIASWGDQSMTLIDATTAYLRNMSVQVDKDQLVAGLPLGNGNMDWDLLERAVNRLGYQVLKLEAKLLQPNNLPCCVALKTGGYAVVVGFEADSWLLLDPQCPEAYRCLSSRDMNKNYAGHFFRIMPSISLLQDKHSVQTSDRHWFWGRLFSKKSRLFDIVVASLVANLLAVVTSLFALQVYDRVIPGQSEATLWVLAFGVGTAIVFEAFLRIARARLIDLMGKEAEVEISRDLFAKLMGMPLDRRPASPGSLVHMVREFGSVKEFFTTASVGVVADLPFVFVFLALIYGIAGNVVWVIIAGGVLTVIPSLLLQGRMSQLSKESMGGTSSASRLLTETAYNTESIKVSRSEPHFQKHWEEITALNAVKTTEQRSISAFLTYWATSLQQVTYVCAVIAGVYMVFSGQLTVGAIIAVSILSTRTLSPITQLSQVMARWQNMKSALDGLEQVMESEQERDPERSYVRRSRLSGSVEVQKVKFIHPGGNALSLNVEGLKIQPGSRVALLGPNGSGKSTLLRVIAGLYHPSEGELLIDGMDIRQFDPSDVRKNIGYLPQEIRLHRGSLRENLASDGRSFTDERLFQALSFGGLGEFAAQHPEGLDTQIVDGGEGLSVGQRQSIGIARLFLLDPSIILLDEPTSSLDQTLEKDVVGRLGHWIGSRTCIVATHRPQILSLMHRIAIMQRGRLVLEGERDAILKKLAAKSTQPANRTDVGAIKDEA